MHEEPSALEVNLSSLRDHVATDMTSGPEGVAHRSPGLPGICAKVGLPVLASLKSGGSFRDVEVDHAVLIHNGLDRVCVSSVVQRDSTAVSMERKLLRVEPVAIQRIGAPEIGSLAIGVEDFRVELARCMDTSSSSSVSLSRRGALRHSSHATLLYISCAMPT